MLNKNVIFSEPPKNISIENEANGFIYITQNRLLTLECSVEDGVPPTNISLLKDNTTLASNTSTFISLIVNATKEVDQSTFICLASNQFYTLQRKVQLCVFSK